MRWALVVVLGAALGCTATVTAPTLANHGDRESVELAWSARADDRDWVHVTITVDGTPFEVGMASGPDDDGSAPSGCSSEPDKEDPAIQRFYCRAASRSYTATLQAGEVVVTSFDQWIEPSRVTSKVVLRVKVRGTKLHVLPYHAS